MHRIARTSLISLASTIFALVCLSATALAQSMDNTVTNFNGRNSISGMIFWPDGTPANVRMRVRLSGQRGPDTIGSSGGDGRFSFSRIGPGLYTVTIDEDQDHGSASASVDILAPAGSPPQDFPVMLRLSPVKGSHKAGVIDADDAAAPKKAVSAYQNALEAAKGGDHSAAIKLLGKALAEYPSYLAARVELGVQYMITGDLEKSDAALAAALKIRPDNFAALVNRGIALLRLNRLSEAEPLLDQAAKRNTASPLAYLYLGRAQLGLKEYAPAEASLKTATGLGGPESKEAHRMLAKLYIERQEYAKGADELETYLKLNPSAPDADQLRKAVVQLRSSPDTSTPVKPL